MRVDLGMDVVASDGKKYDLKLSVSPLAIIKRDDD